MEPKYAQAYYQVASIRNKQERYQEALLGICLYVSFIDQKRSINIWIWFQVTSKRMKKWEIC